jgi:hypothetical protein
VTAYCFFIYFYIKNISKNLPKKSTKNKKKTTKYRQLCLGKLPIMMEVNEIFHVSSFV